MEKNLTSLEAIKKMKELAESVKFCMLATADSSNNLYGRPMTTMQVEDDGTIWFFSSNENEAASTVRKEDNVCLNYADPGKTTYLTVQGNAKLVMDKAKMKELWNPMLKVWFPDGLEDRNITLLAFTPQQAHYWDVNASKLVVLFAIIKASITGETSDVGEYGTLAING